MKLNWKKVRALTLYRTLAVEDIAGGLMVKVWWEEIGSEYED